MFGMASKWDNVDEEDIVAEGDDGISRLSADVGISVGLCLRKRDMKPFKPGPEEGGLATGGGEILNLMGSLALVANPSLKNASEVLKVAVCTDGGVLSSTEGRVLSELPDAGAFDRKVPRNLLNRAPRRIEEGGDACPPPLLVAGKGIVSTLVEEDNRVGEDI